MEGRIHSDLFAQDRYILGAVPIKVKLVRTRDPFCLISSAENPNFKVVIEECVFRARRVTVAPSVMMSHNQALQQTTAKYPINRIDCKVVAVPRGNMSGNQPNIFQGIYRIVSLSEWLTRMLSTAPMQRIPSILRITIQPRWV